LKARIVHPEEISITKQLLGKQLSATMSNSGIVGNFNSETSATEAALITASPKAIG
jgi:hypothetical protein